MIKSFSKISEKLHVAKYRKNYYSSVTSLLPQIEEISKLLARDDIPVFASRIFVQPNGCLMGSSIESAKSIAGNPHFFKRSNSSKTTTLVYKRVYRDSTATAQLHFVGGFLAFAKTTFSSALPFKELQQRVTRAVLKKYLTKEVTDTTHSLVLRDKMNNKLFLNNLGFFPTIYYVADTPEVRSFLNELKRKPNIKKDKTGKGLTDLV